MSKGKEMKLYQLWHFPKTFMAHECGHSHKDSEVLVNSYESLSEAVQEYDKHRILSPDDHYRITKVVTWDVTYTDITER